jgi:penicillin-binding protein 1C
LKTVELCAYSGHLPQAACPRRREALALADRVPTARCPYHVAVDVDLDSGLALSPDCRAGHRWQTRSYVVWPASLRRWMSRGGRYMPGPPSPAAGCQPAAVASAVTAARRRVPPRILSPPAGQVLVLAAGVPASDQEVPLEAETSGHAERLSWFVDGEFLGTRDAEEPLWWTPTPGSHEILVTDDSGASSRRRLEVRGGNSVRLGQASGG